MATLERNCNKSSKGATEAHSLQMALSHRIFLRALQVETLNVTTRNTPILVLVDSNGLYRTVPVELFADNKRLGVLKRTDKEQNIIKQRSL